LRRTNFLKGFDLCVDMFELSVPVDMMAALQALAVDLPAGSGLPVDPNHARGKAIADDRTVCGYAR
jgi:hypothetical protein